MPITTKFSENFYDRLGHGIADELVGWFNAVDVTYRTEFRDLFDSNFGRLDQRYLALEAKVDRALTRLEARIDGNSAELHARIDRLAADLNAKIEVLNVSLNARIDGLDARIGGLEARIDGLDARSDSLSQKMDEGFRRADAALKSTSDLLRAEMEIGFTQLSKEMFKIQDKTLRWTVVMWVATLGTIAALITLG